MHLTKTSSLEYTVERQHDLLLVCWHGRADHAQAPVVDRCLTEVRQQLPCLVLLNLSGLQGIGSLALGALVCLHHAARSHAATMQLIIDNDGLIAVFQRAGLHRLFQIVRAVEAGGAEGRGP